MILLFLSVILATSAFGFAQSAAVSDVPAPQAQSQKSKHACACGPECDCHYIKSSDSQYCGGSTCKCSPCHCMHDEDQE
jgi:hypothetical protein